MKARARFYVECDQDLLNNMSEDQVRNLFAKDGAEGMFKAFQLAKAVPPPAQLPKGGSVGCSATVNSGGGASVTCGGSISF